MTLDEKAGMMLISTTRMAGDFAFEQGKPKGPITNGFNEEDLVQNINMFSRKPLPYPLLSASGTTKGERKTPAKFYFTCQYRRQNDSRMV
jgi:beta-glucosidase